jgi:hypothetical protein
VDNRTDVDEQGQQDPTESGVHARRNSTARPTESVVTPDEFRRTEEPRGTTRSENTEEYSLDLGTAVTVARATGTADEPDSTPDVGPPEPAPTGVPPGPPERCGRRNCRGGLVQIGINTISCHICPQPEPVLAGAAP